MAVAAPVSRGEVCLVQLNPTRPCLIVSPDELNHHLRTVIVAPMTTAGHAYPWRVACTFRGRHGFVALDQLRTVDADRVVRRLGAASAATVRAALSTLREMFTA